MSSNHDFVIVATVEPQDVGLRFSEWPLHITLVPWFSAPGIETVKQICESAVTGIKQFSVTVGQREYFGQRKLPVKLIEPNPRIVELHMKLLQSINHQGWDVPGRYTGNQFRPHVTRHHGKDAEGSVLITDMYIVERLSQGYREIKAKIGLSE